MIFKQQITVNIRIAAIRIQNIRCRKLNRFWHTNTRNHHQTKTEQNQNHRQKNFVTLIIKFPPHNKAKKEQIIGLHANKTTGEKQRPPGGAYILFQKP